MKTPKLRLAFAAYMQCQKYKYCGTRVENKTKQQFKIVLHRHAHNFQGERGAQFLRRRRRDDRR